MIVVRGTTVLPICVPIDSLQSIPRESNDKDVAAMLEELTIEANEESFVIVLHFSWRPCWRAETVKQFCLKML